MELRVQRVFATHAARHFLSAEGLHTNASMRDHANLKQTHEEDQSNGRALRRCTPAM